jgi:uncharacterized protein (DUF488 family)
MNHPTSPEDRLFTVGHSNGKLNDFLSLLEGAEVRFLVDVRTSPYSRVAPQFNREGLSMSLKEAPIQYIFEGKALGGRPRGDDFYSEDGHVLYSRMARAPWFIAGLERVRVLASRGTVSLMCSEENPAECHRHLLLARVLAEDGVAVTHLRADGTRQPYAVMADVIRRRAETPLLFPEDEDPTWRSIRSVSHNDRRRSSSTL